MAEKELRHFEKIYLEPDNMVYSEIMSNGKKYRVPRFQRDYSWESVHWDELWQDIEKMRESRNQHFMGYLVFQTIDGQTFKVIDGQQRLTTLSLIVLTAIKALQSLAKDNIDPEDNQKRIEIYRKTYLGVEDPQTLGIDPKLVLNRHNKRHFRTLTTTLEITPQRNLIRTNRNINKAFTFFQEKFQGYRSGKEIAAVLADIAHGLLFTTITVSDDLDAFTVFETLNARGMHLSTPDLLKNWLLSLMANDGAYTDQHFDNFEEDWYTIIEQLGETDFTRFLRSYEGMRKQLVASRYLFRALRKDIARPDRVLPYLEGLRRAAPLYAALQSHHDTFWNEHEGRYNEVRPHLEVLNIFNIKSPLSVLMAGFYKLQPQHFISLVRYIVVVTIRYNVICEKSRSDQEHIYNKMATTLMNEAAELSKVRGMLKPLYPNDQEFCTAFREETMPSRKSNKKVLYILRKIEHHLSNNEPPLSLTLEHVLPFAPDDVWQEYFGRSTYSEAIDRLGNMALLPSSQQLGQEPFDEKRATLRASAYRINQHIAEYDAWDMDTLTNHQRWLAEQAKGLWKISQLD